MEHLEFPLWLRLSHFVNFVLLVLLFRSGLQIFSRHAKLYLKANSEAETKCVNLNFMFRTICARQGISEPKASLVSDCHSLFALFWIINGLIYLLCLFVDNEWRRIIPDSLAIFDTAGKELQEYLRLNFSFHRSPASYGALQQLCYFAITFVIAPLSILTGAALSPSLGLRLPVLPLLFGGRTIARSIHILLLALYGLFVLVHLSMVLLTGWDVNLNMIVLGESLHGSAGALMFLFSIVLLFLVIFLLDNCGNSAGAGKPSDDATQSTGTPSAVLSLEPINSADGLRQLISELLITQKLETHMEPFPQNDKEFEAILCELRKLKEADLKMKLVVSGFSALPVGGRQCFECIYYKTKKKHCELPELDLPVEPEWWCRLWRI